tara:strand:- start:701 stop:1456 length:756 start_codon:yes stop_codon:yes gene_type:complete
MNIEKIISFRLLITFIFIALISYSFYWLVASIILKNNLSELLNDNNSIIYENINLSGFPTQLQNNINKLKILNSDESDILLESQIIEVSMHPFDISKIAFKSDFFKIKINNDNLIFNIYLNHILSLVSTSNDNLTTINSAIDNVEVKMGNTHLGNFHKIHIKLDEISFQEFAISIIINSAKLEEFSTEKVSIKAEGLLMLDNRKLNGRLNLIIEDQESNEEIFNLPLDIKNNQLIFLFMNIFDLNTLFSFL